MRKNLLIVLALSSVLGFAQSGGNCNYGIGSDQTSNGENITTGGNFEYSAASDFDVAPRKVLTAKQLTFNVLKGSADLNFVNVYILKENQGIPGDVIQSFTNLVPTSQVLAYESTLEDMDAYKITVDFPTPFDLPKGKYFVQLRAAPGDSTPVSWEITNQETTTLGRFDFTKFDTDPWFGGFSYYDHVFSILGDCNSTGEEEPNYGTPISQGNASNNYETGGHMIFRALADDFIVPEGSKFTFTKFKMSTLQLGNVKSATIHIRSSVDDAPGEILYSFENISPKTENFFGYHPVPGFPLDVVATDLEFEWNQPVELNSGRYFIEVKATPFPFTDYQRWEATSHSGIGVDSYTSYDDGETWEMNEGYNFVFDVYGFTKPFLGVNDINKNSISVFPNPVSNELNFSSNESIDKVFIYNAAGQTIKTIDGVINNKLDVSNLSKGIYFVNAVLKNGESKTFKIIKR